MLSELMSLFQAGRYADVEAKAEDALRTHPESGMLWKALSVARSLQGLDALHASQQAAALLPDDPEAHTNLGNALLCAARHEEAAACYIRALELNPRLPEVCNNMGNALRGLGRCDEAIARYAQAIEEKPHFVEAHGNLGNALRAVGRLSEAAASYRRALEINPDYAEAWNNLGNVLFDSKQFGEAAASYRRAIELRPEFAEAHGNLGNALRAVARLQEALACYRRAIDLKPDFAGAHSNLGDTLRDLGKPEEAAASCARAVKLAPGLAGVHNSLGNVLLDLGKLDAAEACYRRALVIEPSLVDALINLALLLRQQGRVAAAEASCRAALAAKQDAAPALVLLAELRADQGDFAQAEALFQRAAQLDADSPEAWAGMVYLRKFTESDTAWAVEAQRVAARALPPRQEAYLRFAIGKYFDDIEDFPRAFSNYRRAHELNAGSGEKYDRQRQALAVDRLIECYDAAWVGALRPEPVNSSRAVFIVGMPRSGTTLAEQILASHPAVFGAGELPFWHQASLESSGAASEAARGNIVATWGGEYLELLQKLSPDAKRVVDKMPANFWCLGLIHEALPGARIIHMQRNPVDTCLSIYFQHFRHALPYADDLGDLAHFYGEYRRIMSHWRAVLPPQTLLDVPYESLVSGQESWSRQMIEFIGLPWDARCLDFHQTSRSVITASKWQVRQKINRSSIERWRNYAQFIEPLLTLLPPPQ